MAGRKVTKRQRTRIRLYAAAVSIITLAGTVFWLARDLSYIVLKLFFHPAYNIDYSTYRFQLFVLQAGALALGAVALVAFLPAYRMIWAVIVDGE